MKGLMYDDWYLGKTDGLMTEDVNLGQFIG
jgi:hypothetical protein